MHSFEMEWGESIRDPPPLPWWNLLGRVKARVEQQTADLILIAPVWPSQPWYLRLLSLLIATPLRISQQGGAAAGRGRGRGMFQR